MDVKRQKVCAVLVTGTMSLTQALERQVGRVHEMNRLYMLAIANRWWRRIRIDKILRPCSGCFCNPVISWVHTRRCDVVTELDRVHQFVRDNRQQHGMSRIHFRKRCGVLTSAFFDETSDPRAT